jgi:hypothetical protein
MPIPEDRRASPPASAFRDLIQRSLRLSALVGAGVRAATPQFAAGAGNAAPSQLPTVVSA